MDSKKTNNFEETTEVLSEQINDLKCKVSELESKISEQKKENLKQFNIRNLKVFASTCNFVAPFVITTALTVGTIKLFCGSLPFYQDEITKYKTYHLKYQTDGEITMNDEYETNTLFDEGLPSSTLTIYTPLEKQNESYVRFKREYDIKTSNLDLYNAVLAEDYNYIFENLKVYKEENQVINKIDYKENDKYFFEAELHIINKEDTLKYKESSLKNIIVTIANLTLGLGIGGLIAWARYFDFPDKLREINDDYQGQISPIEPIKQELLNTKKKILSLQKNKGVKNNEK